LVEKLVEWMALELVENSVVKLDLYLVDLMVMTSAVQMDIQMVALLVVLRVDMMVGNLEYAKVVM